MNGWKQLPIAVMLAVPALAQPAPFVPQVPQFPQVPQAAQAPLAPFALPNLDGLMAQVEGQLAQAEGQLTKAQQQMAISGMNLHLPDLFFQGKNTRSGKQDADYDRGTRALDDRRYDDAVRDFDAVVAGKGPRADGALYWKAYTLNRLGRRDEALAALAALRRDYPNSRWLNDAQALEAEVKQGSGQAVSPGQEANEDLKLMAINSLMGADPERALPLLEGLLKGNSSPKVKDRALFVLTQSRSPRAQQILVQYAKGSGNPDLQVRAIRYIGMIGTDDVHQQLVSIYNASNDTGVKRQVLQALMVSNAKDDIYSIAKNEKDDELRADAIRQLGVLHGALQLEQLYGSETSPEMKTQIIRGLFIAGDSDKLLALAKNEKNGRLLGEAVRNVVMMRISVEAVASLYSSEQDLQVKREVVNGLFARGDAKPLIDLARKETDPAMKRYIVERLSQMRSKEATDYMMELLK
jgi:HEAT repeat protein